MHDSGTHYAGLMERRSRTWPPPRLCGASGPAACHGAAGRPLPVGRERGDGRVGLYAGKLQASPADPPRVGTTRLTCQRWPHWLALVLAWLRAPADNLRTATRAARPGGTRSEGMSSQLLGLSTTDGCQGRPGSRPEASQGVGLVSRPTAVRTMGSWEGLPGGDTRLGGEVVLTQGPCARSAECPHGTVWPTSATSAPAFIACSPCRPISSATSASSWTWAALVTASGLRSQSDRRRR
jgi:hypothetical protein